eukprot:TRINITY_DN8805_c1_g1_i1.p1 TRINITY_DN8805_c1_g1~~TRINITY_DN8805_c1_g1_i1.p1  ORF type:complete len:284 (+),score=78.24 TRINITY_DN8805_c1_g1_i1:609-1460(+)
MFPVPAAGPPPPSMSRPMALALVLLILFLTSQSEWKAARNQDDPANPVSTRQQRLENHRDAIKEQIIFDLSSEAKRYETENARLKGLVEDYQRQLASCHGEGFPLLPISKLEKSGDTVTQKQIGDSVLPVAKAGVGGGGGSGTLQHVLESDSEGSRGHIQYSQKRAQQQQEEQQELSDEPRHSQENIPERFEKRVEGARSLGVSSRGKSYIGSLAEAAGSAGETVEGREGTRRHTGGSEEGRRAGRRGGAGGLRRMRNGARRKLQGRREALVRSSEEGEADGG